MKTKRIRIAVMISMDGSDWSAASGDASDNELADWAAEYIGGNGKLHFVEADIPLPETIEGKVV